jgi:murein DD-endopeptidase MepM/ murein hydrolase activator NlpD
MDVAAAEGQQIRSVWSGTVLMVRRSRRGYGKVVDVRTGPKIVRYAHMHEIQVERGQEIHEGGALGTVGQTGRATGPHLHLEIWERRKTLDPRTVLFACYW